MPDQPLKPCHLMDSEDEPTDEQLAEIMHRVGESVRAESAQIKEMIHQQMLKVAELSPLYGEKSDKSP